MNNNKESNSQNSGNQGSGSAHGNDTKGGPTGTAAKRDKINDESTASGAYKDDTGDPGRTPGSAEGVENFEETGNE